MLNVLFICLMVVGTIANDDKTKKQITTIKIDSAAAKSRPGTLLMLA
ncbi:unnamed protein product [Meloidogyne enterolobii]|uniref:Uncharacterized protein n=1 Tax=Meloidogyne enterolobii TaxID=390850 RepID=A0ACB1B402_MELEN